MSKSTGDESNTDSTTPPLAVIRTADEQLAGRLRTRLWWLTAVCILLALALLVSSFRRQGTTITIRFKDGYGLKTGDTLRYRGIDIGSVTSVGLAADMSGVEVKILLEPGNELIAVDGSQFWIQRARLSLGNVSGLDTVLGAKYVGVIPGNGATQTQFDGTETPLLLTEGDSAEIRVRFPAGEGLEVGNAVRYRGIKIGEVIGIELGGNLEGIEVGIRLVGSAQRLARQGTQFWIERPRIDLTEIRGLDTIVAGHYVALQPASSDAPLAKEFDGLPEPPPLPRREGSLEIELDAAQRMGIVRGAPLIYRGLEVGRVAHVGLAKDGATVKITAVVDSEYAELVRTNSKWWAVGGIEFDAGLSGLRVSVESLSAWLRGGIAFATPESDPGKQVVTGHRFMLEARAKDEWLDWQPRIAIGNANRSLNGMAYPVAVRVVASWKTSLLGIPRRQTEKCWGLALDDGTLALPADFLLSASEPTSPVNIEVAGTSFPWSADLAKSSGAIGRIKLPNELVSALPDRWAKQHLAAQWQPSMVLQIVNPELSEPIALDHTRVEPRSGLGLKIAPGVGISPTLNGSPVIDSSSGELVGMLSKTDDGWIVGKID